jgi:hypothetical protein
MSGFNATIVPGGGSNWYNDALQSATPEKQVSTRVPGLPGDITQHRLAAGIKATRDGATALVKALGLTVDAIKVADASVASFVAAFQCAVSVEFIHMRAALGAVFHRSDFSLSHSFTTCARAALASYVSAAKAGLSEVETIASVGRNVSIVGVDLLPGEDIAIRVGAIRAAAEIAAKCKVGDIEKALADVPPPGAERLPAAALGRGLGESSGGVILPPSTRAAAHMKLMGARTPARIDYAEQLRAMTKMGLNRRQQGAALVMASERGPVDTSMVATGVRWDSWGREAK